MIKYTPSKNIQLKLFKTPFEKTLDDENRWVILSDVLPWDDLVKPLFKVMDHRGRGSIDLRHVLGALIIKGIENLSDEEVVRAIQENIYMQYFVGLPSFTSEPLFTPEVLVAVRKRLAEQGMQEMNDTFLKYVHKAGFIKHRHEYGSKSDKEQSHRGTLKIDATVADQWIGYPIDVKLLNSVRIRTEQIIDYLYHMEFAPFGTKKPRTYRRVADGEYIDFSKKKTPRRPLVNKTRKKLLRYIRRNMSNIFQALDSIEAEYGGLTKAFEDKRMYKDFLVIQHIYSQQEDLSKKKKVKDRIVNVAQPQVRPIVRGKRPNKTEFGSKINASETEGYIRMDQIDYNNFNESKYLIQTINSYKKLYGYFPAVVLVDKIYLNRDNRNWLKANGIKHYGTALGRPLKMSKEEKRYRRKKQNKRVEIEGKFGLAKRKFGLNKIKMKRTDTSKMHIGLIALSMNICKLLADIFSFFAEKLQNFINTSKKDWKYILNVIFILFFTKIRSKNFLFNLE